MDFFKATVKLDKKLYRKAGDAFAFKNKTLKILLVLGLIICLVLGPVLTYLCYITHYSDFFIIPTLGIFFVFYYYFAPSILGSALLKSQSKKNLAKETTYYFSDNCFRAETCDSSSVIDYSAVESLLETDELYCLYVNKTSAFIVPKNSIENPLCDVKMFLESRVGQPFTFVKKKSAGKAAAKIIGIFILSIFLTLLALGIADIQLDKPQTFCYENYSITLDRHFTDWEENQNDDYSLASDEVTFILDRYTQRDMNYLYDAENITLQEIIKDFCSDIFVLDRKNDSSDNYIIKYLYDGDDGIKYFNIACFQQIGDDYWVTQICCEEYFKEDYEEKFEKWISTIKYGNIKEL